MTTGDSKAPDKLRLLLPLAPPVNSGRGLVRSHWAKIHRKRKEMTAIAWLQAKQAGLRKPFPYAKVVITRRACGVEPDKDNLHGACKLVLDALVAAQIIEDDSPHHILLETTWVRANKPDAQVTEVEVERVSRRSIRRIGEGIPED